MELYNFVLKLIGLSALVIIIAVIVDLWHQTRNSDQIDEEPR